MSTHTKTYYCRLPQSFIELINFEAGRVGAGYSTSRALVSKILEAFVDQAPWIHDSGWSFPCVQDVRRYGGDKTGSVQYNIFVTTELGNRLDKAIQEAGVSKASFFLGAICWWLNSNLKDDDAKQLFKSTALRIGFEDVVSNNAENGEKVKEAKKATSQSKLKDSSRNPLLAEMKKNKESPEFDELFIPTGKGDVLERVQRRATSGLVTWEQVNSEINRLTLKFKEYGSDAEGSTYWFVGDHGDSSESSFRKRATMVVLRVADGAWKMVRCYRTNVRARRAQAEALNLAPLLHSRRGVRAVREYNSADSRLVYSSPGGFLRKKYATEPFTFWLGFLLQAVVKGIISQEEFVPLTAWRLSKVDVGEGAVVTFARVIFPKLNRVRTFEVVSLLNQGCDDTTVLLDAMAREARGYDENGIE